MPSPRRRSGDLPVLALWLPPCSLGWLGPPARSQAAAERLAPCFARLPFVLLPRQKDCAPKCRLARKGRQQGRPSCRPIRHWCMCSAFSCLWCSSPLNASVSKAVSVQAASPWVELRPVPWLRPGLHHLPADCLGCTVAWRRTQKDGNTHVQGA